MKRAFEFTKQIIAIKVILFTVLNINFVWMLTLFSFFFFFYLVLALLFTFFVYIFKFGSLGSQIQGSQTCWPTSTFACIIPFFRIIDQQNIPLLDMLVIYCFYWLATSHTDNANKQIFETTISVLKVSMFATTLLKRILFVSSNNVLVSGVSCC